MTGLKRALESFSKKLKSGIRKSLGLAHFDRVMLLKRRQKKGRTLPRKRPKNCRGFCN
ncbi:hypothetical protein EMIT0357P_30487 [Pseudomonas marginalis]